MRRYLHEFDVPRGAFAGFAMTAHANGAGNPNAMYRKPIKLEMYTQSPTVSPPLNQYDVAPYADGAAAIVLTRSEFLRGTSERPRVRVAGSAAAADTLALHDRKDVLNFECCSISTTRALKKAGLTIGDMDFFEYHDAYSIFAALALESAGLAERGCGWRLAADGEISLKGRVPTATMGGLKARGFAGGATGVYQAVEATLQLQGRAGENQLNRASRGLIQSMGGPASTVITHVLENVV
jgi:acetyl-CoA C-acetyltransferase